MSALLPLDRFVKFDTMDFHENLSTNSKFGYDQTTIPGTLQDVWSTFILLTAVQNTLQLENAAPILVFSWQHLTVLYRWQLHSGQEQYNGNTMLHFHSYNGYANMPQRYVIRTSPIFLYILLSRREYTFTTICSQNCPTLTPNTLKGEEEPMPVLW